MAPKVVVLLALLALAALLPGQAAAADRYALAGGCYTADRRRPACACAEQVRLQATALGRYLLYRPDGTFVAAQRGRHARARRRAEPGRGLRASRRPAATPSRSSPQSTGHAGRDRDVRARARAARSSPRPTCSADRRRRRRARPSTAASAASSRATCTG